MLGFRDKNPDPNARKRFDEDDLSIDSEDQWELLENVYFLR